MKKNIVSIISLSFLLCNIQNVEAKKEKVIKDKPKKIVVIKDKMCQDIDTMFQDFKTRLENTKETSIESFITKNYDFFLNNQKMIKRYSSFMRDFHFKKEKRNAQKQYSFIFPFYIYSQIENPNDDEQIIKFVENHYNIKIPTKFKVRPANYVTFANDLYQSAKLKFYAKTKLVKASSKVVNGMTEKFHKIRINVTSMAEYKKEKQMLNIDRAFGILF